MKVVLDTMKPKLIDATQGFQFDWDRLIVRDVAGWINLAEEAPYHPYFYDRCLSSSSTKAKDKTRVFKRPKNPFIFALVIGARQWDRYIDWEIKLDVSLSAQI